MLGFDSINYGIEYPVTIDCNIKDKGNENKYALLSVYEIEYYFDNGDCCEMNEKKKRTIIQ